MIVKYPHREAATVGGSLGEQYPSIPVAAWTWCEVGVDKVFLSVVLAGVVIAAVGLCCLMPH